jgi:glycine/D-amino acid oxidase-like deaminating enzyme
MPAAAPSIACRRDKKMTAAESPNGSTWYAWTMVAAPERAPIAYDLDVDVCVIGGGLAGLTVAREVALRGWSVALLEAERIAWSASGRNGGMVLPGFSQRPERIVERVGLERAKALWTLSLDGVDYVRDTIEETAMPGVDPVDGWLYVQRAEGIEHAEAAAALIGDTLGSEVEIWDIERVRAVLKSELYFQALHFPDAFHIHPLNYALGLAASAEKAGARIFERTRALNIDPDGVRKRVETTGARVRAHHVVLAGSTNLAPLFPLVSEAVLPVVSCIATTAPLGDRLREAVDYSGSVSDARGVPGYFRVVDGDRLMWGGRVAAGGATPEGIARAMQRQIGKAFPQLGAVEIAHTWSGTMGFAMHRMPLIGEVSPGLWVATAFGGHGINTSAMAGDLIARAIIDGDERWRLFASYDLVWAAGRLGLAARRATTWFMQARDWVDERIARRRYNARMRWERIAAGVADEAKRNVAAEAARISAQRIERRHAEAARLIAEEAAQRAAAEAARILEAERRAAEAVQLAAEEAERLAVLQAAEHAAAEAHRAAEAERLAALEVEGQAQADAARRAAEEAERVAAVAGRAAQDEAAALVTAHAARIAAQDVEREAVDDGEAARLAAEKAERAAKRKSTRKKAQATARKPKGGAESEAGNGSADAAQPTRKATRKRAAAASEDASSSATADAVADGAKPKRRRSKLQPQEPG